MDQEEFEQMDVKRLAEIFVTYKDQLTDMKAAQSLVQAEFDTLRKIVIPAKMEEVGFDTVNISGVGRISLRAEIYASIIKDQKDEAYAWLAANGHGALIKDTVNSSSLKAFCKESMINGVELPDDIFSVTPYTMATLTKA